MGYIFHGHVFLMVTKRPFSYSLTANILDDYRLTYSFVRSSIFFNAYVDRAIHPCNTRRKHILEAVFGQHIMPLHHNKVLKKVRSAVKAFTTRTEELTKCCEPLQKLRVRLGTCKTGLSPPVTLCY